MSDCILDIANIFHSATVEHDGNCFARPKATMVLRDVSARVHGGEVLAVLGSKGSGKRALLDVIGKLSLFFILFFLFYFHSPNSMLAIITNYFLHSWKSRW